MSYMILTLILLWALFLVSFASFSCGDSYHHTTRDHPSTRRLLDPVTRNDDDNRGRSPSGIRAQLVHRDHELRTPGNMSPWDRAKLDVKLSRRRAQELNRRAELRTRNGAKRQLAEEFQSTVSSAPGEYVMSLSLGTPAQNFVAVIDTGSDLTWLQCSTCTSCFDQVNQPFQVGNSSTYSRLPCSASACELFLEEYNENWITSCNRAQNDDLRRVGCQYSYFYADSSNTTGDFSSDVLYLQSLDGNLTRVANFSFGCSRNSFSPTSLFEGSDGLVGMAQGGISFPSQIGAIYGDVFSYCLVDSARSRSGTSTMYFGVEAAVFNITGLRYTPFVRNEANPTFYYVGLEGITVDGTPIDVSRDWFNFDRNGGGVFFDSGTTLTILEPRAMAVLDGVVTRRMNYSRVTPGLVDGLDYCWDIRGESSISGPKITFKFTDADYDLALENAYIVLADQLLCLAMAAGSDPGSATIIGNIQQRNYHVVYDRVQNRMGWVQKECSAGQSVFSSFLVLLALFIHSLLAVLIEDFR